MNKMLRRVQVCAALVVFAGTVAASPAPAARFDPCTEHDWEVANCGFSADCWGEFGGPPTCGEGYPDTCWTEGGTVYYEGWCSPDGDCDNPPEMC